MLHTGDTVSMKDYKNRAQTAITNYVVNRFFFFLPVSKIKGQRTVPAGNCIWKTKGSWSDGSIKDLLYKHEDLSLHPL